MNKSCEVIIYTSSGGMSFNIVVTVEDFQERLAKALEEGTVILDTVEGSKLILNAINVVAIEVNAVADKGNCQTIPPVTNM